MSLWQNLKNGDENFPQYPIRVNLTKLLIELHMLDEALILLQNLLQEDDEIVETNYLTGWCYYLMGEEPDDNGIIDEAAKKEAWDDARLCFTNVEKLIKRFGLNTPDDQSILQHSLELKDKITKEIGEEISTQVEANINISDDMWENIDEENGMDIE